MVKKMFGLVNRPKRVKSEYNKVYSLVFDNDIEPLKKEIKYYYSDGGTHTVWCKLGDKYLINLNDNNIEILKKDFIIIKKRVGEVRIDIIRNYKNIYSEKVDL